MIALSFAAMSCNVSTTQAAEDALPAPQSDLPAPSEGQTSRTAVFAGGCFWCTEAVFEEMNGVTEAVSGYAGGSKESADYKKVSAGQTDHAEAIRITYDPRKVTYGKLLQVFFAIHDPTTKDRQGPDWGRQYRSAVFYQNDDEKRVAEAYIKQLTEAKCFDGPIVTTLEPLAADGFYSAEDYHQDYVKHHPQDGYVRQNALPKLKKLRDKFTDALKK
jgi:peptide-methionine (S)-S-oxide reductase